MGLAHKEAVKRKKGSMDEIREKMEQSRIAILTDYRGETRGMSVAAITNLRTRLREVNAEYKIYKNTLCRRVMKDINAEELSEHFVNPTAIVFGFEDSASTSKALVDFIKEQKKDDALPMIKIAWMEGEAYNEKQVKQLATLPSRDELLSTLLRTMNAPAQNLVGVLAAIPRQLVTVLDRIREEKEKQAS
ncbi:MAG: 50S ribosomal protein L10 [Vulcanimicrobiota bacterium]